MEPPVGRERSSKHGNTSDMLAPSSPQLQTRWLEAWRTTSDCTRGALGLLCALEPLMTNLHRAREVSVAHLYGGGGKRASRMLREKSSHSHSSGQPEYGPNSSNMQSVDFERGATPLSHGTGGVRLTPAHTPNDHSEDGRGSTPVPPIDGFSMFVRRWESQAAVAVAEGGESRRRRRQNRVDSDDEALDDDDNEGLPVASETARPADSNRRLRSGFGAPRVKQLGELASGKAKQEEEEDEEEEPEEDEEDEEYELGSEANFGEDGHLACVPGDVLHNRYALVRQLGCGCRSRVWLAVDLNQCSVTRRQLVRELDEQQVRRYFTALDRPLFVAIKVFRCGVVFTQAAEHETLMLMYIKECKKVRQLQRLVSTPSSRALSREVSAVSPPREPAQDGALTTLSDGSRSPTSHCQSNSEETMWLPSAERVISIRECFKHHGPFGLHHCVVMDVMGASVSALMKEAGPHGVPENVARGIVHSTLEGLALLASIHVIHTDIKPDNLLCVELEEDVANDVEAFLMYHFDMPVPTGLDGRAVRRSVAAEDSSMNQSQESYFVSAQTSLKDVVDTPRTARSRSSCGTARRLFRAQHHWGSRAEAPYSVQLADFGLSFIVPPDLRHFHCTKTYDGAECSGAQEGVAEDTVSNPSKLLNGDSFLAASTLLSNAVASVGVMSSAANPFQDVTLSSKPLTSSGCATSGVSELEQEILSRQNFGRGLALQSREYRSPEIILGRECYTAIDIWSIGCITFELVCGRLLFDPVRDFSEAEERNERAEEQQKQRDQNFTTSPEFNECEGKDADAAHDSDETKHAIAALGPNHFVEREKNVDVCHLRAMILLLGAPNPRYITSSPTGECVKDFFDDNGEFLFLTDDERAQLYDCEGKQCRTCSFSAPTRVVECERGASEDETNLPRHSTASAATCARCRVTPLWLKVRHEIEERLGAEDGAVFEGFLLKCLQWDPSRRSTAHALRKDAWVTGAEDVVTTVEG